MEPNRRQFIQGVGVMLASLVTTRCAPPAACYVPVIAFTPTPEPPTRYEPAPPTPTCYTPAPPTSTPTPAGRRGKAWDRLRKPWHDLDRLARDAGDLERGERTRERLIDDHRAALDDLVSAGELAPAVADEMQAAFAGAAYHVWRGNAPMTCYEPAPGPDYQVESGSDLARQADLLAEMAGKSAIDPATIAQAQAAIQRDVVFLAMTVQEQRALLERVQQAAGDTWDFPTLSELTLDIPPESAEAARILVELLLER
jgi:hypothetical protein